MSEDDVRGVRVWVRDCEGAFYLTQPDAEEQPTSRPYRTTPYVAHDLSDEAQAARRDAVERAMDEAGRQGLGIASQARYVLEELGLTTDPATRKDPHG